MHIIDINGGFFSSMKINNESHSKRSHRLFIDFQYQSIDKYRLDWIDIDTHRLSISSIKYAGIFCSPCSYPFHQTARILAAQLCCTFVPCPRHLSFGVVQLFLQSFNHFSCSFLLHFVSLSPPQSLLKYLQITYMKFPE